MIRPARGADRTTLLELAVAAGLFPADATDEMAGVFDASIRGELGPDHVWLIDEEGAAAYYAPERMTDGTWNLHMIAVDPGRQRQGRSSALVRHVERDLASRGARLLLVETSGQDGFARARAFYRTLGFTEEARIRDFYKAGDDKIVFRREIA